MPSLPDRFDALAAALAPDVETAWLASYAALHGIDEITLAAAIAAAGGDISRLDTALAVLLADAVLMAALAPALRAIRAIQGAGGAVVARTVGPVVGREARIGFDAQNPRAVRAAARSELDLFRVYAQDVRAGARALVTEAVRDGLNPRDAARRIRPLLGLTDKQARIVDNARRELLGIRGAGLRDFLKRASRDRRFDPRLERLIRTGGALTPEQVDAMIAGVVRKTLARTAENVARTESHNALMRGQEEAFRQTFDALGEDPGDYVQVWVTNLDGRERPTHRDMHGVAVAFGEPWEVPGVGLVRFPGEKEHGCRCARRVVPRWLYESERREAA